VTPLQDRGTVMFISSKDESSLLAMAKDLMFSDLQSHSISSKQLGEIA